MKETINIDVELKEFIKKYPKAEVIIVNRNNSWVCVSKDEFLKDSNQKIQELKDVVESYRLDNIDMKNQIEKFKKALNEYGFNLMNGGNA